LTRVLTPKEKNLLIRLQKNDMIKYSEFPDMLYNVRYEIAMSEMMESNKDDLHYYIRKELAAFDKEDTGLISIHDCMGGLQNCKQLNLTPFQLHILMGISDCDGDGMVPYKQFCDAGAKYIQENFQFQQQLRKKELYDLKTTKISKKHKVSENLDELELFRIFKKYDRNMNGTLEINEYMQCLAESKLGLTKEEVVTSALAADCNQDGHIDFEEFMKHFSDFLDMINFFRELT
jgi:Ca2+-binding EF-hand superfamily protein